MIVKEILYNKRTSGHICTPNFKLYYKAIIIKNTWYWHKNRQVDELNWRPRYNSTHYGSWFFFFYYKAKSIQLNKETARRRMQRDSYLLTTKLKFKWIKELNIKPDTMNLRTEPEVGNSLVLICTGDNFLNRRSVAQALISNQ